ncbi:PREDICTED: LOW QUALITY PROTEIN: upstream-binding protein 1 [Myotis davidii]|uniref:LOW QUALITY PROTEIN: upstream-binding protein 1 n=1 Tax=Myotis davidii TaxID=225400 RepID=UPI00076703D6|nr:PREDICTED: LOW QUALITY PROTEIN: upstream-binding protein 1 [Myotis davidii]
MLFWHNQLEHLWPSPGELYPGPPSSLLRESLPLPYLKQEELPNIPSMEPPCPSFQYVLRAATSPAVKQQEEALTYLNQGQSYEVQMLCNSKLGDATQWPRLLKSVVRVVFHDRRLQYTEQQQLEGWRWSRPGDRILDIDVPLSVGVIEPQVLPSQLNTVEFHWDPTKRTSLFLQVHCISTEFTPRKKGGEKGVPFRLQIDTFKPSDKGLPPEHLHSAGCLIKVFKPKGADRKLKTDREKVEKQPLHERDKYQAACESTVFVEDDHSPPPPPGFHPLPAKTNFKTPWSGHLPGRLSCASRCHLTAAPLPRAAAFLLLPLPAPRKPAQLPQAALQCSPWPEPSAEPHLPLSPQALTSPHSCKLLSPERLCCSPPFILDTLGGSPAEVRLEPPSWRQQWLHRHRFSSYCRTLANFTGTDLLKLTRQDLIQICGAADGIRLFNTLRARPIRHRLTLYVAQEASRQENEVPKNPEPGFYQEISLDELSAIELMGKLAELLNLPANQIHRLFHQGPGGILILLSDQVVQNLKDEAYFVAVVRKGRSFRRRHQFCVRD